MIDPSSIWLSTLSHPTTCKGNPSRPVTVSLFSIFAFILYHGCKIDKWKLPYSPCERECWLGHWCSIRNVSSYVGHQNLGNALSTEQCQHSSTNTCGLEHKEKDHRYRKGLEGLDLPAMYVYIHILEFGTSIGYEGPPQRLNHHFYENENHSSI